MPMSAGCCPQTCSFTNAQTWKTERVRSALPTTSVTWIWIWDMWLWKGFKKLLINNQTIQTKENWGKHLQAGLEKNQTIIKHLIWSLMTEKRWAQAFKEDIKIRDTLPHTLTTHWSFCRKYLLLVSCSPSQASHWLLKQKAVNSCCVLYTRLQVDTAVV